jgi:predicted  nucleic acid-binding Zn-ribbon protein
MSQIIVRCPSCGNYLLVKAGSGYLSEVVTTEQKKCQGCAKDIEISVRISAKVLEEKKSKA